MPHIGWRWGRGLGGGGVMCGASAEQVQSVRQHREDGAERGAGSGWAAGEVDDQRGTERAADGAAERGERRVAEAFGPHTFGQAVDDAVADLAGGLRGDVAGGEAGASGGDDEVGRAGVGAEEGGNLVELVGESEGFDGGYARSLQELHDGGAGAVDLQPGGAAGGGGEDGRGGGGA